MWMYLQRGEDACLGHGDGLLLHRLMDRCAVLQQAGNSSENSKDQ
jgi:hypothetical protein